MDFLNKFLADTALQYPILMTIVMVLGIFRAVFKPIMSVLQAYVLATPTKDDDAQFETFQKSKAYATLVWLVDYLASIKIPEQKPKPVEQTPITLPVGGENGNSSSN